MASRTRSSPSDRGPPCCWLPDDFLYLANSLMMYAVLAIGSTCCSLLRPWLGWMERIDDTHWRFRMEPYHVDILRGIPALSGLADAQPL